MLLKEIRENADELRALVMKADIPERHRSIALAIMDGKSTAEVAAEHGTSAQRAGGLARIAVHAAMDNIEDQESGRKKMALLPVRARNCLLNMGARNDADVIRLWDGGNGAFRMINTPNFSKKSLLAICNMFSLEKPRWLSEKPISKAQYERALSIVKAYERQNKK